MLFQLGQIVMTCGIAARMGTDPSFARGVRSSLGRHATGDWGDVGEESRRMNDDSLEAERNGEWSDRLFSLYDIEGTEIFIITEADRSATTILFPEEY